MPENTRLMFALSLGFAAALLAAEARAAGLAGAGQPAAARPVAAACQTSLADSSNSAHVTS